MKRLSVLLVLVSFSGLSAQNRTLISVFPFEDRSETAQQPWLVYGWSDLVARGLEGSGVFQALPMDEVHRAHIDADIYPLSLFEGKTTPTFLKYHLDWQANYCVLGSYRIWGDSVEVAFRLFRLPTQSFTRIDAIKGQWVEYTDFYLTAYRLMEALYAQLITQLDFSLQREVIVRSHDATRSAVADLEAFRSYIRTWMALKYYEDGIDRAQKRKWDDAIRYFRASMAVDETRALNTASNLSSVYVLRAGDALALRRYDEAVRDYRAALDFFPKNIPALYNLGNAFKEQGNWAEALEHYQKVLGLDPGDFDALINSGYVLEAQGRHGEAAAAYERAVKVRDSSALAYYYLGVALDNSGDTARAMHSYRRAIELDPTLPGAHLNLGIILKQQKDFAGARKHYTSAITYDPNNALAHRNLGILLMNDKKETAQALWHLERTLELDPNQPDADAIRKNIAVLKKRKE